MLLSFATSTVAQPQVTILDNADPSLRLGEVSFLGGNTIRLSVGIGSAAHRRPTDPADIVHTLSDRGLNFTCAEAPALTGVPRDQLCAADRNGCVYPMPGYAPMLYGLRLDAANRAFHVFDAIALKDRNGRPLTGLTNPLPGRTEAPIDAAGRRLDHDASVIDAERLPRDWRCCRTARC